MSSKLKLYLGNKVVQSLRKTIDISPSQLKPLIQIGTPQSGDRIEMNVPLNVLENYLGISNVNEILKIQPDDIIQRIQCVRDRANRRISFEINRDIFVKDVIECCTIPDVNFNPKKIVIEYSSPNVAKPFHVGHLRSTIIGNFIGNLNAYLNNNVRRLNYLGDWGTQFGFIKVGVNRLQHTNETIQKDPLRILYEAYVYANKLAETDPLIAEDARKEFAKLENGSSDEINTWKKYLAYTVKELEAVYDRLGMRFDEYTSESMYGAKDIQNVINLLNEKNILEECEGKKVAKLNDRKIALIKSDGTTLYLTRDIAAAVDRYKRYEFDQMYYVVENGQNDHFNALRGILHKMDYPWADRLKHVKFGRVRGMSTRKGKVVFLQDILEESRDLMKQKQIESPTTKVPITDTKTTDILGVSCVIINDLKQRRQKDYEFSWDRVLQAEGDSGIKLQYTHCRLCSLERRCGVVPAQECNPKLINDPEVTSLVRELGRFQDVIYKAQDQIEACVLVTYLFHLCNYINKALKVLQVKDQEPEIASQRLLVFSTARKVLGQGMKIIGLQPLKEM